MNVKDGNSALDPRIPRMGKILSHVVERKDEPNNAMKGNQLGADIMCFPLIRKFDF